MASCYQHHHFFGVDNKVPQLCAAKSEPINHLGQPIESQGLNTTLYFVYIFHAGASLDRIFCFYTLFMAVIQYYDRKHVFHTVPHSTDVGVRI